MPVDLQKTSSGPDLAPEAARLLRLLADPARRQIFFLLMRGEVCNCELSADLGLPQNLVSHHVRKLREAGLVEEHRDPGDARWVHLSVDLEALGTAWASLASAFDPARAGTRLPACGRTAK
jgi:DNA-binding transcriptional ArsR family regulator